MKNLLIPILLFSNIAHAGTYVEVGAGIADGYYFIDGQESRCQSLNDGTLYTCGHYSTYQTEPSIMGLVEIGYESGGYSVFFLHLSSLPDSSDRGINMIGVKYRFGK